MWPLPSNTAGLHLSFNHRTRDPIILRSGLNKCCYTLCTAAELKWSGNDDGSKLEVEIVRD